jgi:aspartate-semialdehyde dehydrogenase
LLIAARTAGEPPALPAGSDTNAETPALTLIIEGPIIRASMSKNGKRNVAIVGATGAVGEVLLQVLAERRFPVGELRPLASERSAGTTVRFGGAEVPVELARAEALDGADFVFFAATGTLSKDLAPEAARRGAVAIDKSSTWRMDPKVPLVIPEVNPDALQRHEGIVACPNCTTIGFVMALEPIRRAAGLRSVVVTTLQAVSGAGRPGIDELEEQVAAAARGERITPKTFAAPIAYNVVPLCETFRDDGYSTEEVKLLFETRKIMNLPDLDVAMTCVRVPVPVGHSATVLIETERPLTPEAARKALADFPGVRVEDDPGHNGFPTPASVAGHDEVVVGRIRKDLRSNRLWLWEVSDNLRKGAATNAVQIAEEMMRRGLR